MSKKQTSFLHNWTEIGGPDSGLVKQVTTGREGERRIIALDPLYDPKNEQFIYQYRRESKLPYVSNYGSEMLKLEKPAKTKGQKQTKQKEDPYNHIAVITERIPFRLADAPQLTYPQALYVLDRSLQGFEGSYQQCGPMRVSDRMIGFNNDGYCKIWVNEDFANNHPSFPRRKLMSTRLDSREFLEGRQNYRQVGSDQADMVQDVVDVVESYSEQGMFPQPFSSQIHQRNIGFSEARRLLHDNIVHNRILVPEKIDLVKNMVRGYRRVQSSPGFKVSEVVVPQVRTVHVPQVRTVHVPQVRTTYIQKPQSVLIPSIRQVPQMKKTTGYRFNYLPTTQLWKPTIFASRVDGRQSRY